VADNDQPGARRVINQLKRALVVRLILVGFLVAAGVLYALVFTVVHEGVAYEALHSIAEALLVAVVLGVAGDLYLKFRLAEDSVRRGVQAAISETFGFLDPAQPSALQAAVKEFASARLFARSTRWTLVFDWEDREAQILGIRLSVENNGLSLHDDGYLPDSELWALQSTMSYKTKYLKYSLHCPDCEISVDETETTLEAYLDPQDNRLVLDQVKLLRDRLGSSGRIAYGKSFNSGRATQMYRHAWGHVPLMHSNFEIECSLAIDGGALDDLKIAVFQPKSGSSEQEWHFIGREAANKPMRRVWRNVTPGQATIVSWGLVDSEAKRVMPMARPRGEDRR
jgi:hypothetical protein